MNAILKKMVVTVLGVAVISALGLAGCGGSSSGQAESTGTPGTPVTDPASFDGGVSSTTISIRATDAAPAASVIKSASSPDATDEGGGLVTITSARAAVDRVELEQPDGRTCADLEFALEESSCVEEAPAAEVASTDSAEPVDSSDANEIYFPGPFIVDLLAGTSTPPLESLVIPSAEYHAIQLKLVPLDPLSTILPAGDVLLGNSMVLEGSYAEGGGTQLFRIVLSIDHEISFESAAGVLVSEAVQINEMILGLDVNSWFAGIDVGACLASGGPQADGQGVLVIDASVGNDECNFLETLKENIESSSSFDDLVDDSADDSPDSGTV